MKFVLQVRMVIRMVDQFMPYSPIYGSLQVDNELAAERMRGEILPHFGKEFRHESFEAAKQFFAAHEDCGLSL
jgi:hypothetical protein